MRSILMLALIAKDCIGNLLSVSSATIPAQQATHIFRILPGAPSGRCAKVPTYLPFLIVWFTALNFSHHPDIRFRAPTF